MSALRLRAPSSKSMTQRALFIAALADGPSCVRRPLLCDDSRFLSQALRALGCELSWGQDEIAVRPAPLCAQGQRLFCGNAGTAVRFSACLALLCEGSFVIDGDAQMRGRPLGPLGDSLEALGVEVRYLGKAGSPPVRLARQRLPPEEVRVDTSLSSQYASGLLMVAPRLSKGLRVELTGGGVSMPYLRMTTAMMSSAGARLCWEGGHRVRVEPGGYHGSEPQIEPDWSAAAFLLVAARLRGLPIEVVELPSPERSLQGDAVFADMLRALDQPGPHRFDLREVPDLIAPLTAACLFAAARTTIRGAAHTRVKECDRVAVLCRELGKLGARLSEDPDGLDVEPLDHFPEGHFELDPASDHRMAMAFGLVSLRVPGIVVCEPSCVGKSFPDFWNVLAAIRAYPEIEPRS